MIAEIFSDLVEGKLRHSRKDSDQAGYLDLQDLESIFDKMGLPLPEEGVDISKTREGGYNLMLNPYGAVLRIYPSSKEGKSPYELLEDLPDDVSEKRRTYLDMLAGDDNSLFAPNKKDWLEEDNLRLTNIYHPNSLPVIGRVQFQNFAIQLMPGEKHGGVDDIESDNTAAQIRKDTENKEFHEFEADNYINHNGKVVLIDPVHEFNIDTYLNYSKETKKSNKNLLEQTIDANKPYEELQELFDESWGNSDFSTFWTKMKQAKGDGLLADGWNNSPFDMDIQGKGDIVALAAAYEERLNELHSESTPRCALAND